MLGPFSMDAGTLIYPFTFTLRDMVHKIAGIKAARTLIIVAAIVNIFMALFFWLVSNMAPDSFVGEQLEFGYVLSPIWRIVAASIIAEVFAEMVDTEAYRLWVDKVTHKYQWARVLLSNSISVPIDSLIFVVIAFYGVLPNEVVISILIANILLKYAVTLLSLPMIYLVKAPEGEPRVVYDKA